MLPQRQLPFTLLMGVPTSFFVAPFGERLGGARAGYRIMAARRKRATAVAGLEPRHAVLAPEPGPLDPRLAPGCRMGKCQDDPREDGFRSPRVLDGSMVTPGTQF